MRFSFFLFLLASIYHLAAQPDIMLEEYATGFDRPLDIAHAGDARLFVVEKKGVIKLVIDGNVMPTPFLNINARVRSTGGEQGLLGLVFHPNYADNGWFFVNYIDNSGNTRVSRFSVSADDPNLADPDSELLILPVGQPYSNHNGGCLKFGPDGYLYIGLGDGGAGGDPDNYGQNRQALLGKMLRIDVNASTINSPYLIPETNPFANDDFTLDEIWAIGIRNPWRFTFDRQTGDLWIGDVGQNVAEEIDFQAAESPGGENYGWRCYEGEATFNTFECSDAQAYDFPIFEYLLSFGNCAVTGGYVYRGSEIPDLNGYYLFADYCRGVIIALEQNDIGNWVNTELLATNSFISSFGEDLEGEVYITDFFGGKVLKIITDCAEVPVTASIENESCAGQADGSITLMTAPENMILWSTASTENPLTNLSAGDYMVTVTNDDGCQAVLSFEIINNTPASPEVNQQGNDLSVPNDYAAYQWYLDEGLIPSATLPSYSIDSDGDFFVIVTNDAGCSASSDTLSLLFVNTLEALNINYLEVTPVPFNNNTRLTVKTTIPGDYTFSILTASGEQVFRYKKNISSFFTDNIDMSRLTAGLYFLLIEREGQYYIKQLIKQ